MFVAKLGEGGHAETKWYLAALNVDILCCFHKVNLLLGCHSDRACNCPGCAVCCVFFNRCAHLQAGNECRALPVWGSGHVGLKFHHKLCACIVMGEKVIYTKIGRIECNKTFALQSTGAAAWFSRSVGRYVVLR